jgi:predicted TIM-barrel fold metal-dependent hydrolase
MPYVENRVVHDADSHLMELPDSLDEFLETGFRARYDALPKLKKQPRDADFVRQARAKQDDPQFRDTAEENILLRKNYEALGSFKREDRPRALDQLGFTSQLIFTTWCLGNFDLDQSGDVDLCYAVARAHNRMMSSFCSVDRRFLGTGYVPLVNFEQALATAGEAIDLGCKALLIPSRCPPGISPSHVGFEPLWSLAQEARLPIVFHVGG